MSNASVVYEGVLPIGVKYRLHQSSGFSNKCDLAIEIFGQFVSVITVAPRKNGHISIVPTAKGRISLNPCNTDQTPDDKTKAEQDPIQQPETINVPKLETPFTANDLFSDVVPQ